MGSAPSAGDQKNSVVRVDEGLAKVAEDLKNDSILKEIVANVEKEPLALKPSQSVNLQKAKNQTKVKKVRDIRSLQTLKDMKAYGNQNRPVLGELATDEIQDVSVAKKVVKQLNPVTKKKLASDRALITQQSKTQNVVSMIPLAQMQTRMELQSRTKRYRVSKML